MWKKPVIAAAVALLGISAFAGAANARDLKMSLYLNENHFLAAKVFIPMGKNIEEFTKGEIKVQVYPSSVLGKAPAQLELVETGIADMAFVVPSYTRGRFPFYESGTLPFAFESAAHGAAVYKSLLDKYLTPSFGSVHPLVVAVSEPSGLLMAKKPITGLDQVKGLTIRGSSSEQTKIMGEVGANTVSIPITDTYVALERGTIDGVIVPVGSAVGYKLEEVSKFYTPMYFAATPVCLVISKTVWDSFTPEQQAAVTKAADIAQKTIGVAYAESEGEGTKVFEKAGGKVVSMPDSDLDKLREMARPLWDEFEANLAKQKSPEQAKAFMADFRKAIEDNRP
ncbi:MAG: TRAP transporter substrate-binding protein [Flavobacteriaceae bacterium]